MLTILAGSFLLFLVQAMAARIALAWLGGAPNVWSGAKLAELTGAGGRRPLARPTGEVWRKDFASILPRLRWGTFF